MAKIETLISIFDQIPVDLIVKLAEHCIGFHTLKNSFKSAFQMHEFHLLRKLECSLGFPQLRKTLSPHVKITIIFKMFQFANQLLTRHSLYLAP